MKKKLARTLRRLRLSFFLFPLAFFLWPLAFFLAASASAATITAASPSFAHVSAAVVSAVTGDTVAIPAGTAYWPSLLSISGKGITIQGAGADASTGTVIVDENPVRSLPTLIDVTWAETNTGAMFRLTNCRFKGGVTNSGTAVYGFIRLSGSNNQTNNSAWRIDHCYFDRPNGRPMTIRAWSGLVDNCSFDMGTASGVSFDARMNTSQKGDVSWATPWLPGTTNSGVYLEHCTVTSTSVRAFTDGFAGAKFVARFNILTNRAIENHGTESTQRARGGRACEVYGNTFVLTVSPSEYVTLFRSGTSLIFSNTVVGNWPGLFRTFYDLSVDGYQPWRQSDGRNPWDLNVPGGPFATGTHTGGTATNVLTDGTKSWTVNQWAGYSLINTNRTYTNGAYVGNLAGLIESNTATTITTKTAAHSTYLLTWGAGNHYLIYKVDKALDAVGRGQGALLSGTSDTVPPTPTAWPDQADEPIYAWGNTGKTNMSSGVYPVIAGRDYIMGPPSFDYTPLVDPHPLAGGLIPPAPPAPPDPGDPPNPRPAIYRRALILNRSGATDNFAVSALLDSILRTNLGIIFWGDLAALPKTALP